MADLASTNRPDHARIRRTLNRVRRWLSASPLDAPMVAMERGTVEQMPSAIEAHGRGHGLVELRGALGLTGMGREPIQRSCYEVRAFSPSTYDAGRARSVMGQLVAVVLPCYELDDRLPECPRRADYGDGEFIDLLELMAAAPTLLTELCEEVDALLTENRKLRENRE